MKDVEKSRTSFIRVNLRVLREKHLFQCPPDFPPDFFVLVFMDYLVTFKNNLPQIRRRFSRIDLFSKKECAGGT